MLPLPNQFSHLRLNLKRVGADSLGEIMMEDREVIYWGTRFFLLIDIHRKKDGPRVQIVWLLDFLTDLKTWTVLPQNRVKQTLLKNGELYTLYNYTQKALGAMCTSDAF